MFRSSLLPYRLVLFGSRHEENLSYLDRHTARLGALTSPPHGLLQVSTFQYPQTTHVFLGFYIRSVGDEQFTVRLRAQRLCLRAETASKLPDASRDHFAIERVNFFH